MKRFIALLLVFSMLIPLAGCSVDEDDLKDLAKDAAKEVVGDVVDDAVGNIEDSFNQKKDELIDSLDQELPEMPKTGSDAGGSGLSDQYCYHDVPYKYNAQKNVVTCKCGREYQGTVGLGVFKTLVPAYTFLNWLFQGLSEDEYYLGKYATYLGESVCDLYMDDDISHTYVFDKKNYEIKCEHCSSQYPVADLKFSVFLKYYYPNKEVKDLKQAKKENAIDPYIKTKTLMTGNEMFAQKADSKQVNNPEILGAFEFYGMIAGAPAELQKRIPIINSQAFYLIQNYYPVAFSDVGIDIPAVNIKGDIDSVGKFLIACGKAETSIKKEDQYDAAKAKGIENVYKTRAAYLEYAIANAETLAAFADFVFGFCGVSTGVPSPDIGSILKHIEELAQKTDLRTNYEYLSSEKSLINGALCVNDVLSNRGITKFAAIQNMQYPTEAILEAMKKGPTAKEIAEAIPYIIEATDKTQKATNKHEQNLVDAISAALWYYYGWRIEYEYDIFLEWIQDDEPCSFQKYLKDKASNAGTP